MNIQHKGELAFTVTAVAATGAATAVGSDTFKAPPFPPIGLDRVHTT